MEQFAFVMPLRLREKRLRNWKRCRDAGMYYAPLIINAAEVGKFSVSKSMKSVFENYKTPIPKFHRPSKIGLSQQVWGEQFSRGPFLDEFPTRSLIESIPLKNLNSQEIRTHERRKIIITMQSTFVMNSWWYSVHIKSYYQAFFFSTEKRWRLMEAATSADPLASNETMEDTFKEN